jgi:peptidoglycan/LPS O-acetylase OafA/YrhL
MVHIFVFQVAKMAASYIGHKTHLDLVGWHNNEKLVLLGTPEQAVLPALILSVVLVVPVAALTYRWIEKPALEAARRGVSMRAIARSLLSPARAITGWLKPVQAVAANNGEWRSLADGEWVVKKLS